MKNDIKLVSIIIPTYNSQKTLKRCLDSIRDQTYKNIEIIVIDNNSKDNTVEMAKSTGASVIVEYCNKPMARNIGLRISIGEYICFIDSDMNLAPKVIEECISYFKKGYMGVVVPEKVEGNTLFARLRTIEKDIYTGIDFVDSPQVYDKKAIEHSYFDEDIEGPDEYDFYLMVRQKVQKIGRISSYITVYESFLSTLKKRFRQGKSLRIYKYKYRHRYTNLVNLQLSPLERTRLLYKKIQNINLLPIIGFKFLEYMFYMSGYTASFFDRKFLRLNLEVSKKFDDESEFYETHMYHNSLGSKYVNELEMDIINDIKAHIYKKIVLEIGAGNGRWSKEFVKYADNVVAIDISKKMCHTLKENICTNNFEVINCDIEKICINNSSKFNTIFSFRSFKYVKNTKLALNNMRQLLHDEGILVVEIPNLYNPFYFIPYVLAPYIIHITSSKHVQYFIMIRQFSIKEFKKELRYVGLKVTNEHPLFFLPHFIYSLFNSKRKISIIARFDQILVKYFPFMSRSFIITAKLDNFMQI